MNLLDDYSALLLKKMYDDCMGNLKKKANSLILYSLEANKNTIRNALNESKIEGTDQTYETLLSEGYIRCIEPGTYVLTAKGAWSVESEFYNLDISKVLDHLDSSKFMLDSTNFPEKNKIILFALLSARCFTEDTCAEYSANETKDILQLFKNSADFLMEYGCIKPGCFGPSPKASSKSELGNFTGSIDKLPSQTYFLFKPCKNGYYLDVSQNGKINKERVTSLFKIVFGGNINIDDVDKIVSFCNDQCMYLGYVYHLNCNYSFSGSEMDGIIEECILSAAGL